MTKRIDDIIAEMDRVVAECRERRSRLGYFAALYRKVTIRVKEGIERGEFDDGPRMEALDIVFAGRYLDAYAAYHRGEKPTQSWLYAFERSRDDRLFVLQHLLLGMNAHINLDLGIAAARTAPGAEIDSLRHDFDRINEVLASLLDEVQGEVGAISPVLSFLDNLCGNLDETICNFSMARARTNAWRAATRLASLAPPDQVSLVDRLDNQAHFLAQSVAGPFYVLNPLLRPIFFGEREDVVEVIDVLM